MADTIDKAAAIDAIKSLAKALDVQGSYSTGTNYTTKDSGDSVNYSKAKSSFFDAMKEYKKHQALMEELRKKERDAKKKNIENEMSESEDIRKARMDSAKKDIKSASQAWHDSITELSGGGFKESIQKRIADWSSKIFSAETAIGLFTKAAVDSVNIFKSQIQYGAMGQSFGAHLKTAAELGVDPQMLSKLQAQNRASVIAMGGVQKWGDALVASKDTIFKYTGDLDESVQFTADSFKLFRNAGITPTTKMLSKSAGELSEYGTSIKNISKMSGLTFTEVNSMMSEFIDSEEIRYQMAKANGEEQRKQILLEIASRQTMLMGLGMMTEQAKAAGKALDKMAAAPAKERFKKAAQAQAMFGALGMGKEGAEAAAIERKGQAAQTPEEKKRLAEIYTEGMKRKVAIEARGGGAEMGIQQLAESLNMNERFGPQSPWVIVANKGAEAQIDANKNLKTVGENNANLVKVMQIGNTLLKDIAYNPIWALLAGTTVAILVTLKGMALSSMLGKGGGLGSMLGKGGGIGGSLAEGVGGLSAKSILKGGAFATAMVGIFGGIKDSFTATEEEVAKQTGNIWGDTGKSFFSSLANHATFTFTKIGDNILEIFGLSGKLLGESISKWFTKSPEEMAKISRQKDEALDVTLKQSKEVFSQTGISDKIKQLNVDFQDARLKEINKGDLTKEQIVASGNILKVLQDMHLSQKQTEDLNGVQANTLKAIADEMASPDDNVTKKIKILELLARKDMLINPAAVQ